jgi:NADH-quinone oxidoreductase subunit M
MMNNLILTIVTFTPALGALLLLLQNRDNIRVLRTIAVTTTVLSFVFSLHLIAHFDSGSPDFQYVINAPWDTVVRHQLSHGCGWHQPVPGAADDSAHAARHAVLVVHYRTHEGILHLHAAAETGMIGVFCSLDLFLFYVLEVMLIPMLPHRVWATAGLFGDEVVLYTMIGGC